MNCQRCNKERAIKYRIKWSGGSRTIGMVGSRNDKGYCKECAVDRVDELNARDRAKRKLEKQMDAIVAEAAKENKR